MDFLLADWKECIKFITLLPKRREIKKLLMFDSSCQYLYPSVIYPCKPGLGWSKIAQCTSCCRRRLSPDKYAKWSQMNDNSCVSTQGLSMTVIITKMAINSIRFYTIRLMLLTNSPCYGAHNEHAFCRISYQVLIPANWQSDIAGWWSQNWMPENWTHRFVLKHECLMTWKGLMYIPPRNPFYVYIANWTTTPMDLEDSIVGASELTCQT